MRTLHPSSTSRSARCEPINPAAPVTSARFLFVADILLLVRPDPVPAFYLNDARQISARVLGMIAAGFRFVAEQLRAQAAQGFPIVDIIPGRQRLHRELKFGRA